jgi:hypothetical protein
MSYSLGIRTAGALALVGLLAAAGPLEAVPFQIGLFSGTLVNFNSVSNEELITNQFSGSGVNFSGAIYGMTNFGDTQQFPGNGGGVIASNWIYSLQSSQGDSFTATFDAPQRRIGFYSEINDGDNVMVELFNGTTSLGSITFPDSRGNFVQFLGLENESGFDRAVLTVIGNDNHFVAVDNWRFSETVDEVPGPIDPGPVPGALPEPGTLALMTLGLAGFSALRRTGRI